MKNTGCSLLLALLLCGCAASPAVVPFHYDNGPDYVREGLYRIVDDRGRMGYADESGRVVIAPRFRLCPPLRRRQGESHGHGTTQGGPGLRRRALVLGKRCLVLHRHNGPKDGRSPGARRHPTAVKTGTSPLPPAGPFTGRPRPCAHHRTCLCPSFSRDSAPVPAGRRGPNHAAPVRDSTATAARTGPSAEKDKGHAHGAQKPYGGAQSLPVPSVFPAGLSGSRRVSRLASTGTSRL